jgi:bacterioferritin-associated ferredoxin
MYVCICNAVTDSDIRKAVADGVCNLGQLRQATGCGTTCGCCKELAGEVLQQSLAETRETPLMLPGLQMA